jgi:hypothetical protein
MSQHIFNSVLIKKDGKLQYSSEALLDLFNRFVDKVEEGKKVEVIFQVYDTKASATQIAKVHANIREIATDTGHTFDEIKTIVKKQSGLYITKQEKGELVTLFKSFAECSRDELSLAIQASIEIGENLGINLY